MNIDFLKICSDVTKTAMKIPQSQYLSSGQYPIFDQGQKTISGYSNDVENVANDFPYIVFGDHTRVLKYVNEPCYIGADGVKLLKIINNDFDTKYVFYALLANPVNSQGYSRHFKFLKERKIKFVSKKEQCFIVEKLDLIRESIELKENELKWLDELIKSRFIEMFGHPVLSKKYNVVTIADMVKKGNALIKAGPFGSSLKKEYYVKSGYKIYGQEQVINDNPFLGDYYIDEQKYRSLISCKVEPGDVLISLVGTCGKTMIIPDNYEKGIINPRLLKIHFRNDYINPIYFKCFFADEELQKDLANKSGHSTMNVMNVSILKNVNVIVPPIELQDEFASFIEQVDKSKFIVQEQIKNLQELFDKKMDEYFGE